MARRRLRKNFEKQLKVYSAAAAGALALAPAAEAVIHYSGPQNILVDASNTPYDIDFDGSGPQFSIGFGRSSTTYPSFFLRYLIGIRELTPNSQQNAQHLMSNVHSDALNLSGNYPIGPTPANPSAYWRGSTYFDTLNGAHSSGAGWTSYSDGNFNNATGYIGVRFQTSCGRAYGWIHYQGSTEIGEGFTVSGTIIDWAYQDNCQPIAAGQTTDPPTPVPTLNEWGMIIFTLLLGGLAARKLGKHGREES